MTCPSSSSHLSMSSSGTSYTSMYVVGSQPGPSSSSTSSVPSSPVSGVVSVAVSLADESLVGGVVVDDVLIEDDVETVVDTGPLVVDASSPSDPDPSSPSVRPSSSSTCGPQPTNRLANNACNERLRFIDVLPAKTETTVDAGPRPRRRGPGLQSPGQRPKPAIRAPAGSRTVGDRDNRVSPWCVTAADRSCGSAGRSHPFFADHVGGHAHFEDGEAVA